MLQNLITPDMILTPICLNFVNVFFEVYGAVAPDCNPVLPVLDHYIECFICAHSDLIYTTCSLFRDEFS